MRYRLTEDGEMERDWCVECDSLATWSCLSPDLCGKWLCLSCGHLWETDRKIIKYH